MISSLYCKGNW